MGRAGSWGGGRWPRPLQEGSRAAWRGENEDVLLRQRCFKCKSGAFWWQSWGAALCSSCRHLLGGGSKLRNCFCGTRAGLCCAGGGMLPCSSGGTGPRGAPAPLQNACLVLGQPSGPGEPFPGVFWSLRVLNGAVPARLGRWLLSQRALQLRELLQKHRLRVSPPPARSWPRRLLPSSNEMKSALPCSAPAAAHTGPCCFPAQSGCWGPAQHLGPPGGTELPPFCGAPARLGRSPCPPRCHRGAALPGRQSRVGNKLSVDIPGRAGLY